MLTHRLAIEADLPVPEGADGPPDRRAAARLPQAPKSAASFAVMGFDVLLVADRTHFIAEADGVFAGCGVWSRRATRLVASE